MVVQTALLRAGVNAYILLGVNQGYLLWKGMSRKELFSVLICLFHRVSTSCWPGTHYVGQTSLEPRDPSLFNLLSTGIKGMYHHTLLSVCLLVQALCKYQAHSAICHTLCLQRKRTCPTTSIPRAHLSTVPALEQSTLKIRSFRGQCPRNCDMPTVILHT